ncbi:hypothetical protein ACFLY8_01505 [Halobacteriota archaeon]
MGWAGNGIPGAMPIIFPILSHFDSVAGDVDLLATHPNIWLNLIGF